MVSELINIQSTIESIILSCEFVFKRFSTNCWRYIFMWYLRLRDQGYYERKGAGKEWTKKKEERRKENTNIFENFYVPCFAHSE